MDSSVRIIVAGSEAWARDRAVSLLGLAGFDHVIEQTSFVFDDESPPPDLVVATGALLGDLCAEARTVPALANVPILALTDDPADAVAAGASDVLPLDEVAGGGFGESDLRVPTGGDSSSILARARILRLIDDGRARREADLLAFLHESMSRIVAHDAQSDGVNAMRQSLMVAVEAMGFDRASLVAHVAGSETAYVVAASDDPTLYQFSLTVANYPEIEIALDTGEPVLVPNVVDDPLTASVAEMLASTDVRAIAVFPILWRSRTLGVVMYRKRTVGLAHLGAHRRLFGKMFASHMGGCLRHSDILESLREQTQRISRARFEAERRLQTIESLKQHFEAAADGVIVLEESGRILYVNRTAENITGFARSGLLGADIAILVVEAQREVVRQVIEQVIGGHNLEAFDLNLRTTSEEAIWASVTTSTVLSSSGAAILSFRDVTGQRALESELRKTKEFLEKLVDSTVDAIVASDLRGNVIIFNQGAERLFGYSSSHVIGRIPVWELYAKGVPKQMMRMLRSTQYGGVGRLEQTRREILNKHGDLVPVNMTASIIYEDGQERATVGIFSDLRDRIRIEQRLLQAQEKLQLTEKQAVIAELAGTTAHELNQPLQSIMSYTELLRRRFEGKEGDPLARPVEVIMEQTERMAEIVKKIGRITKYETTEYVGSTRVLDLELSSPGHSIPPPHDGPNDGQNDRRSAVGSGPMQLLQASLSEPAHMEPVVRPGRPRSEPAVADPPESLEPGDGLSNGRLGVTMGGFDGDGFEDEITNQVELESLLARKERASNGSGAGRSSEQSAQQSAGDDAASPESSVRDSDEPQGAR